MTRSNSTPLALRIQQRLKIVEKTARKASLEAGLSASAIRNILEGKSTSPRGETLERLAAALGTTSDWLLRGGDNCDAPAHVATVPVVGMVGAGGEALFADGHGNYGTVEAPPYATHDTVAVEIRGTSLGALLDRWIVFYDNRHFEPSPYMIGRLCVVGLPDGRVVIKKLMRGRSHGNYDLHSNMGDAILDVPVTWAALVTGMVPQ